ncbi:aminotransferase class I/II-fold pyridoxal phosphate-dependent enzyme [Eubacteriaceae bacterium ES2]|nr:aminotransferase class I/II-fold pyridoxal phosphate-dependent enzyme [Eubacteriaceae bacterium ES2]
MNKHGGYHGGKNDIIDFSVNINPLGIPQGIKEKLIQGIESLVDYPEITGQTAIEKLAAGISKRTNQLILGNGAIELIYLLARSMTGKKALIIQPTFNEYSRALKLYGCQVTELVLTRDENFRLTTEKLRETLLAEKPDLLFLCNPNNPTGVIYTNEEIKQWMDIPEWEMIWFFDESFMDFTGQPGMLSEDLGQGNFFVLKSLTKFYALPGLRIGYGAGNPKIIEGMMRYKEPWTINSLGLIALSQVYQEKEFAHKTIEHIDSQRKIVFNELQKISSIEAFESAADFHLCRIRSGMSSLKLKNDIEQAGMSLRTCEDFLGLDESYFRIAIKSSQANKRLIEFLKKWKG